MQCTGFNWEMILKKRVTEEKYFFKNKTLISVQFPIQSQNGSTLDRKKRVVRKVRTRDLTIEVEERQPTTLIISGREVGRQFVETSWFSADQDQKEITKFKPYTGWGEAQPIEANCIRFPLKKEPLCFGPISGRLKFFQKCLVSPHKTVIFSGDCHILWAPCSPS